MSSQSEDSRSDREAKSDGKRATQVQGAIDLIPQPTDDPRDPLNWPTWRKRLTFTIACISSFSGLCSAFSFTSGLLVQAKAYHVSTTAMSYSVSSAISGLMLGPIICVPLSKVLGITATLFWTGVFQVAVTIWGAKMTGSNDYVPFVVSRGFAGFFGTTSQVLGNGIITNIFFLHQRGKAFAFYSTFFILGAMAGQSLGGFIIQHTSWTVQLWYTLAPQGLTLALIFFFLEDTSFNRDGSPNKPPSSSWIQDRLRALIPGSENQPTPTSRQLMRAATAPFLIILSPVTIMAGLFQSASFGWLAFISTLFPIFLEEPYEPEKGIVGYGFTPQQTSAFAFSMWFGIIAAYFWGEAVNDRIPLLISRRQHAWKPEYRLYALWLPGLIIMPIGLGLFGAGLNYHLHYMVLAFGAFFIVFSGSAAVPASLNYVVESFELNPQEVGICMNLYRLLLGLIIPFFLDEWRQKMSIGWVFGTAAFVSLFTWTLIMLLMWKGASIRLWSLGHMSKAIERGAKLRE